MTSISILTLRPALTSPKLVWAAVCGMMLTREADAAAGQRLDLVDGERDAVERDRALGGDIGGELGAGAR